MARIDDTQVSPWKAITAVTTPVELSNGSDALASQMLVQVVGTISAGTFSMKGSNDGGTTLFTLLMVPTNSATPVTAPTAAGAWRVDLSGVERCYIVPDGSFAPVDATVKVYYKPCEG